MKRIESLISGRSEYSLLIYILYIENRFAYFYSHLMLGHNICLHYTLFSHQHNYIYYLFWFTDIFLWVLRDAPLHYIDGKFNMSSSCKKDQKLSFSVMAGLVALGALHSITSAPVLPFVLLTCHMTSTLHYPLLQPCGLPPGEMLMLWSPNGFWFLAISIKVTIPRHL